MVIKKCTKCKIEKPATLKYFRSHPKTKLKLQSWCKKCESIDYKRYRHTDAGKKIRRENRRKNKQPYKHKRNCYGLTAEQHKNLYLKQNGCCKICNMAIPYSKIVTDHDHKTGRIRGLLCVRCNVGIGMLKDDINILCNAISYLKN